MDSTVKSLVPDNIKGTQTELEHSITANTREDAVDIFKRVCKRMPDINIMVSASYHGRNEVLNTDTGNLKDTLRNAVIGAGAMIGISALQWSRLVKSFLEKKYRH